MSFWKNLYNEGKDKLEGARAWTEQQLYNIGETAFGRDSRGAGEPRGLNLREYGEGGEALDDFWRNFSGQESYYEEQARIENDRYWQDYHENTGIDPEKALYPIKSGINMNNAGQQIPMMGINKGKRAINMLYGGQE